MRILLTTDTIGGVWRYSATLARALSDEGHAVLLAVVGSPTEEQTGELPEEIELEVRESRLEWQTGAETDLGPTAAWLLDLERSWRPDILHLNQMTYAGLVTYEAPTVVVVHSDVCSWFSEVRGAPAPADWLPYRQLVRSGLQSAARVVAPSRYQADLVVANYGRIAVSVIHNGVDFAAITGSASAAPSEVRRPPESPGGARPSEAAMPLAAGGGPESKSARALRPRLLTVGRAWDQAKGVSLLDDALLKLGQDAPEAHLIGSLGRSQATAWRPRRLVWLGELSGAETARWMRDADLYVAPALYEPFGLAPVEAALSGCALLLSDIGAFRELWDGHAEFVERGSASALAAKIATLCRRPHRVKELARSAGRHARKQFTPARFAENYLDLYSALLRGRGPRPYGSLAGSGGGSF